MPQARLAAAILFALVLAPTASCAQKSKQPAAAKPLFSENFDSGAINKNIWTLDVTGDAILTVESDNVAHGKYALLARCPAPARSIHAYLWARNLPEPLRHHLFGRAYVYITPVVPDRHTVLIQAGTPGFPRAKFDEVATSHSNFQTTFTDNVANGEDWHPGPAVPLGRWFLLEWEFNDQPASETIWVDGERVMDTPFTYKGATTGLVGGFTDIAFGFFLRGAAPDPFDIYFNSIALDTHRIGPVK